MPLHQDIIYDSVRRNKKYFHLHCRRLGASVTAYVINLNSEEEKLRFLVQKKASPRRGWRKPRKNNLNPTNTIGLWTNAGTVAKFLFISGFILLSTFRSL